MGAPKGNNNNPKGRGNAKGKKTLEWEEFGRLLMEAGLPRMLEMIRTGDDDDVLKIMLPMIEYFKPKLARTENTNTNDNNVTITVNWDEQPKLIHQPAKTTLQSGTGIDGVQTF